MRYADLNLDKRDNPGALCSCIPSRSRSYLHVHMVRPPGTRALLYEASSLFIMPYIIHINGYGNKTCSKILFMYIYVGFFSRYSSGVSDFVLNVCQWLVRDPQRQQALWRHVSSSRSGIWCTSGHSLFSIRVLLSTVSDRKGKQFNRSVSYQCICFNSKPQFNFMAKQVMR